MSKVTEAAGRDAAKVMNRSALTERLTARLKRGEAVIGGIGNNNFDLWASGQRPENFYMLGSMGLAAPIGLGVAIAQPDRKVFALDGDGSLLMHLGALGTVAASGVRNLAIVAWDNGLYQITGSQETLTARGTDLVTIAQGAGIEKSEWVRDEDHFDALVDRTLNEDGPWFFGVRIDGAKPAGVTERDPVKIRLNFMAGIRPGN
jgi:thiamine pyrophosphate-dependent acetolactate synthase large subunit-like protein